MEELEFLVEFRSGGTGKKEQGEEGLGRRARERGSSRGGRRSTPKVKLFFFRDSLSRSYIASHFFRPWVVQSSLRTGRNEGGREGLWSPCYYSNARAASFFEIQREALSPTGHLESPCHRQIHNLRRTKRKESTKVLAPALLASNDVSPPRAAELHQS